MGAGFARCVMSVLAAQYGQRAADSLQSVPTYGSIGQPPSHQDSASSHGSWHFQVQPGLPGRRTVTASTVSELPSPTWTHREPCALKWRLRGLPEPPLLLGPLAEGLAEELHPPGLREEKKGAISY